jgi:hypothetical protein
MEDSVEGLKTENTFPNTFFYQFALSTNIEIYERYPENIVSALSKIGGIKALLGIGLLVVSLIHERLFEKKLAKDLNLS